MYASADVGYWDLGTSDAFYGVPAFPAGVTYTSYANWDAGHRLHLQGAHA